MYRYLFVCFAWLIGVEGGAWAQTRPTVFLVGASTVATFADRYAPMSGWGQEIGTYFVGSSMIDNRAVAGKSSRSFIEEGAWSRVLADVQAGDYVFIQFGHNDQKRDHRATDPYGSFQQFLTQYIQDTRAQHATPILVTPVVRRRFKSSGELYDTHGDYPDAVRQLAAELAVPLIDLHQRSAEYFTAQGEEASRALFLWLAPSESPNYPRGVRDNTHFSQHGARQVAQLVIDGLMALDIPLKNYVRGCAQEITKAVTICQGDSTWVEKGFLSTAGVYHHLYQNRQGCDSTVITTLVVLPTHLRTRTVTIDEGDSVRIGQHYRYRAGTYADTLQTQQGCDSLIMTTLRVTPLPTYTRVAVSLCAGDSLWAEGSYQKAGGTFYDTLLNAQGGVDITITRLAVAEPITPPGIVADGDLLRCATPGDSYRWFLEGQLLSDTTVTLAAQQEGLYSVTVRVDSCSSLPSSAYYYRPSPIVTGTHDKTEQPLRVYRPGNGLYIRVAGAALANPTATLSVYDLLGNRLHRSANQRPGDNHETGYPRVFQKDIYFGKQPKGFYVVTLGTPNGRTSVKFYWTPSVGFAH